VTTIPGPIRPGRARAGSANRERLADALLDALTAFKYRIAAQLPDDVREELAGTTPHQCEALLALVRTDGATMNELASAQGIRMSSCTALVDRLLRNGLVERASDPSDRRVVRVVPTERARTFAERFWEARRRTALTLLDALTDQEAATFIELTQRIAGGPVAEAQS
jgi:DNA-binding MarR family transcriptional regulator